MAGKLYKLLVLACLSIMAADAALDLKAVIDEKREAMDDMDFADD